MKKLIVFISLVSAGLMTSCVDKYEEVPSDSKPSWLGGSIWSELEEPSKLTGTFTTYMKLVEDLNYKDVLNKTGSKTIFPANDEAFQRFFADNSWGVSSYDQLSEAQKKQLLYSSMIDNALLVSMLANVSNDDGGVYTGQALKHATATSVLDSITYAINEDDMPKNNKYWDQYKGKGIYFVSDNTTPMMVHFTREQMVNNSITTTGENSDFEVITGVAYDADTNPAFIFKDQIINRDITCQNGYIHQVKDVLVPPGNVGDVLRNNSETSYMSRMLDYFCAPYYDATTTDAYNTLAMSKGTATIDSIYQRRYFSARSQGSSAISNSAVSKYPNGSNFVGSNRLNYDPGWNGYFPSAGNSTSADLTLTDVMALFAPNDKAVEDYFVNGEGAYLIELYGDDSNGAVENTAAKLPVNLDSLYSKKPNVVTQILNNLLMSSFIGTVPSKFSTITNDANENMGLKLSLLNTNSDGTYDVRIANNGVVYVLNEFIAPDAFSAVLAPTTFYNNMKVMRWCISEADPQVNGATQYLEQSFDSYLMAMQARYLLFIPTDDAFEKFYIDPTSLKKSQPLALYFHYDDNATNAGKKLICDQYQYTPSTNTIGQKIKTVSSISEVKSQLVDILNYHTVVLEDTKFQNEYYKTKHGGEIYTPGLDSVTTGGYVYSGGQLQNGLDASQINTIYTQKNGWAYAIDHVIQAPQNSVYKTLEDNSQFSEFIAVCEGFGDEDLLAWAGLSSETSEFGTTAQTPYVVFTSTYGTGTTKINNACLDYNVRFFNTYNYTLYAPNNDAMKIAYANGLPNWDEITEFYEAHSDDATDAQKAEVLEKINMLRRFVRYHFQSTSVYADNVVESQQYQTMFSDDLGVPMKLTIADVSGQKAFTVTDEAGVSHTISASGSLMTNRMARDYWFNSERTYATSITTSSFCVVHEISEPLYCTTTKKFDYYED